jgi:hypothetical protein
MIIVPLWAALETTDSIHYDNDDNDNNDVNNDNNNDETYTCYRYNSL